MTMNLGQLIDALSRKDPAARVVFDFVYFRPDGHVHSYRGDYSHLAIGYTNKFPGECLVKDLLAKLNDANGKVFTGYKGGDYLMDRGTPVWVADGSESGGTGIVDVNTDSLGYVVLITKKFD